MCDAAIDISLGSVCLKGDVDDSGRLLDIVDDKEFAGQVSHKPVPSLLEASVDRARVCKRWLRGLAVVEVCLCRTSGSRSEEHTSELQSLMRISYAVFCLKKKKIQKLYKQRQ